MDDVTLLLGKCEDMLPTLPAASFDVVLTDPPYPCIDRSYGYWTEEEWFTLMRAVVPECMRVLKPTGSAVFILQPNSERVGRMRTWLWEFMLWVGKEWGIVQDAWWWNFTKSPTVHCQRERGLMRPSVKAVVWVGPADCYRDQDAVLWESSMANVADRAATRALEYQTSGGSMRRARCALASEERGGVTPFNLLPIANADSQTSAGAHGHGAGTPAALCDWWLRYLCPPGGAVLDPFVGSGTVALAAFKQDKQATGIEANPEYHAIAEKRIAAARNEYPLFAPTLEEP